MSLNPFPVTDLRQKVELMHLLHMRRHYCQVWNRRHWTNSEFTWTLSGFYSTHFPLSTFGQSHI